MTKWTGECERTCKNREYVHKESAGLSLLVKSMYCFLGGEGQDVLGTGSKTIERLRKTQSEVQETPGNCTEIIG